MIGKKNKTKLSHFQCNLHGTGESSELSMINQPVFMHQFLSFEASFIVIISILFIFSILLYSTLGCVLPLQEAALCHRPPTYSVLCYPCPYRSWLSHSVISPTTFGLPTDLTSFICHPALLMVHLSSFIQAVCPAHFQFALVSYCVCHWFFA